MSSTTPATTATAAAPALPSKDGSFLAQMMAKKAAEKASAAPTPSFIPPPPAPPPPPPAPPSNDGSFLAQMMAKKASEKAAAAALVAQKAQEEAKRLAAISAENKKTEALKNARVKGGAAKIVNAFDNDDSSSGSDSDDEEDLQEITSAMAEIIAHTVRTIMKAPDQKKTIASLSSEAKAGRSELAFLLFPATKCGKFFNEELEKARAVALTSDGPTSSNKRKAGSHPRDMNPDDGENRSRKSRWN
jgi:hypothetical protein